MAAVRSGHGRCADLESRLLSGERWIYVDQQSLLKIGSSGRAGCTEPGLKPYSRYNNAMDCERLRGTSVGR